MKPLAPCKGCDKRHPLCWDHCETYLDYQRRNEAYKKTVADAKKADFDVRSVLLGKYKKAT